MKMLTSPRRTLGSFFFRASRPIAQTILRYRHQQPATCHAPRAPSLAVPGHLIYARTTVSHAGTKDSQEDPEVWFDKNSGGPARSGGFMGFLPNLGRSKKSIPSLLSSRRVHKPSSYSPTDMSAELRGSSMARVRGKTPHPPLEVI